MELLDWGPTGWGDELARGLAVTLALAVLSYALGLVLGLVAGLGELGQGRVVPALLGLYGAVLRSLPELLVIFAVFFTLPGLLNVALRPLGLSAGLPPFWAGVVALGLVTGAYVSEVVKGAMRAVPRGMREAATALGLSPRYSRRLVVLPLALRHAYPGLVNLWMVVIKMTPLVSAIQLEDLIRAAGTAGQNTKHYFLFYGLVLAAYLVISGLSMAAQSAVARRVYRHDRAQVGGVRA